MGQVPESEAGGLRDAGSRSMSAHCYCDLREVGPVIHPRCLNCGGWIDAPVNPDKADKAHAPALPSGEKKPQKEER